MPKLIDQIKRLERRILGPEKPAGEPKTDDEWLSLIRGVDRAFNGGFCHNFKRPKYSDEEKDQILALRLQVQKLAEDLG